MAWRPKDRSALALLVVAGTVLGLSRCGNGSVSAPPDAGGLADTRDAAAPGGRTDLEPSGDVAVPPDAALTDVFAGCAPIPAVAHESARLAVDSATGRLVDALGRDVVLRGLNAGGRAKFAPFVPFDIDPEAELADVRAAADLFFARFLAWGLDTVRLTFSWEAWEPTEGALDDRYLARYGALVDAAWAAGIRVIVDMHQDVFSSPLCGDGFPPWTVADIAPGPPRHDCPFWYLAYFGDEVVSQAFDRFWSDETGVRTKFVAMWERLAAHFAAHPGVVGFELLNEPAHGSAPDRAAWKTEVLAPFHANLAARLRAIAPEILVFYDEAGLDAVSGAAEVFHRPAGEGLAFAPHMYDPTIYIGLGWDGSSPEPALEAFAACGAETGTPILIGEFGVKKGLPDGTAWVAAVMGGIDRLRLSATLWEYSHDDELWNAEDFGVIDADGTERDVLDGYVRPWLRAVAGTASSFTWDPEADRAEARWTATAGGVTEIVVPARLFPEGPRELVVAGEGVCHTWDGARGELRVTSAEAGEVSVAFRP